MNTYLQQLLESPVVSAAVAAAVAFVADRVASLVGRFFQFRSDSWQAKVYSILETAIRRAYLTPEGITTGETKGTNGLPIMDSIQAVKSAAGKLTPSQGQEALSLAAGIARNLAEQKGVDLVTEMGGNENLNAHLQAVFDEIKAAK